MGEVLLRYFSVLKMMLDQCYPTCLGIQYKITFYVDRNSVPKKSTKKFSTRNFSMYIGIQYQKKIGIGIQYQKKIALGCTYYMILLSFCSIKCKKRDDTYTPSLFVGDTQEKSLGVALNTSFY
jgi:hypothetical protein